MSIDLRDFSKDREHNDYAFGLGNRNRVVSGLGKIQQAVADGSVVVQRVELNGVVTPDDYLSYTLVVEFTVKNRDAE